MTDTKKEKITDRKKEKVAGIKKEKVTDKNASQKKRKNGLQGQTAEKEKATGGFILWRKLVCTFCQILYCIRL